MRHRLGLAACAASLVALTVVLYAAPQPRLDRVTPSPIPTSESIQTMALGGSKFQIGMRAQIRETSVQAFRPAGTVTVESSTVARWDWIPDVPGSYILRVANPDNKYSGTLTILVSPAKPPPPGLVATCPTVPPVASPDGNPVPVTFPSASASGGTPPYGPFAYAPPSGSSFPVGTTQVTATVTDAAKAQASCSFPVQVTYTKPDPIPPASLCASGPISLTEDITLTGSVSLLLVGSASSPCVVNGNGHRIIVADTSGTKTVTIDYAVLNGLGSATTNWLGGVTGSGYAYFNGGSVSVRHTTFRNSGAWNLYTTNGTTVAIEDNTVEANQAIPILEQPTISWLTEQGNSVVAKSFKRNRMRGLAIDVGSPNWTVGGSPADGNVCVGKRCGISARSTVSGLISYNYSAVDMAVTPDHVYWSQITNGGPFGAGVTVEHNVFRGAHWVVNVPDGRVNDNVLAHAHGHNFVQLGTGGRLDRNILTTPFPAVAAYPNNAIPVMHAVGVFRPTDSLAFLDTVLDARGPDWPSVDFYVGDPAATLTHTGTRKITSGADARGPLPIGSGQSGNVSANQAGFPFDDEDVYAGIYGVADILAYYRWVTAPPGSGGTPPVIAATNKRPVVRAGPSFSVASGATAYLWGYGADDGLPTQRLSFAWSKVSGPGTVTFADVVDPNTTATAPDGAYVIRLTATDGVLTSTSDASITFGTSPQARVIWQSAVDRAKVKAAANDPDWVTIKGQADRLLTYAVPPYHRDLNPPNSINYLWQGSGWYDAVVPLALAYQVTGNAAYAAKVREVVAVMVAAGVTPIQIDNGYPTRSAGFALAVAKSWTGETWTAAETAAAAALMQTWHDWVSVSAWQAANPTAASNYFGGHLLGIGLGGQVFGLAPVAAHWRTLYVDKIQAAFETGIFRGGYPAESFNYGPAHFQRVLWYALAMRDLTGEDLVGDKANKIVQSFAEHRKPGRWRYSDEGIFSGAVTGIITKDVPTVLTSLATPPFNGYAKYFLDTMAPSGTPFYNHEAVPLVRLLFLDQSVAALDYRTVFPTARVSPGDYHLLWRSSWEDDATWISFAGNARVLGGGATQRCAGHIAIQVGDDYLFVNSGMWRGVSGVSGEPHAFDDRSKRCNTLIYPHQWNAAYDGGQGYWGGEKIIASEIAASYAYMVSELTSAYHGEGGSGLTNLTRHVRSTVVLQDNSVVVREDVEGPEPKVVAWHAPLNAFSLTPTGAVATVGQSKVTVTSPTHPTFFVEIDTASDSDLRPLTSRLETREAASKAIVLTVLQPTAASATPSPVGPFVNGSITVGNQTVTFDAAGIPTVQ